MPRRGLTAEQVETAKRLHQAGLSGAEIARELGAHPETTRRRLVAAGVDIHAAPPPETAPDEAVVDFALQDGINGYAPDEIADRWGLDQGKVVALLEEHGLEPSGQATAGRGVRPAHVVLVPPSPRWWPSNVFTPAEAAAIQHFLEAVGALRVRRGSSGFAPWRLEIFGLGYAVRRVKPVKLSTLCHGEIMRLAPARPPTVVAISTRREKRAKRLAELARAA